MDDEIRDRVRYMAKQEEDASVKVQERTFCAAIVMLLVRRTLGCCPTCLEIFKGGLVDGEVLLIADCKVHSKEK